MNRNRLQQRFAQHDQDTLQQAFSAMMQHYATRKLLWWLLAEGESLGIQPYSRDPYDTAFKCGELNARNRILAEFDAAVPGGMADLMKEMANERSDRNEQLAAASGDAESD
jgi:hypothetical protein